MARLAFGVAAACFATQVELLAACNCETHMVLNTTKEAVSLKPKLNATSCQWKTPQHVVDCIAAANLDPTRTFIMTMSAAGDMLATIAQGKAPSQEQLLKDAGNIAVAAIGMLNPILGIFASFAFSFFQALYGGDSSAKLYEMIMQEVKDMIRESELNIFMTLVHENWVGYRDTIDSHPTRQITDDYFTNNAAKVFQGCYDHGPSGPDCKTWSQHGAVAFAIHFAANHLQTELQIASYNVNDRTMVLEKCGQVKSWGSRYVKMLRNMVSQFQSYRLHTSTIYYYLDEYQHLPNICFDGHASSQQVCRATLTDSYTNDAIPCSACSSCRGSYDYRSHSVPVYEKNWKAATDGCFNNYNDKISKAIDGMLEQITAIENLEKKAGSVCAPSVFV